ncbi:hypothetical protein D0868_11287 [Hortaea werneckii]|uniref:Low temperature viability protein n=1 Tax=Hortaea werneckii TaxID=91943 RepID=A0A3M6Y0H2_HORWE|nr:hypothetical protein D0868_11287 [Hortaea werneckii]
MPKAKWIDKENATTFSLVHRAQNDPLIHDQDAPSMVFAEKQQQRRPVDDVDDGDDYPYSSAGSVTSSRAGPRSKKTRQRGDLEDEFGLSFKPHEGEAAQHGVFYDDTKYDYMQHMRDLGSGEGPVTWVEASAPADKKKGKQKLEDALRDMDIGRGAETQSVGGSSMASEAKSLLPEEVLPSEFVKKRSYQDQQDVPDDIAGFQPDMDPRLREVLEALDDEEYVDDEEDIFAELTKDGYEVERDEWEHLGEQQAFDDGEAQLGDDGWESDDTIRAASPPPNLQPADFVLQDGEDAKPPEDPQAQLPADPTGGAWIEEMKKFKADDKAAKAQNKGQAAAAPSAIESSALSSLASGKHKKRKGAKTSTDNYSMTSSALARTDQQTLLDARFDKIIEEEDEMDEMADDEASGLPDNASMASGLTGMSKASKASKYSNMSGLSGVSGISSYSRATDSEAPQLQRSDFNSIMDDFLGNYSTTGKAARRVKRGGPQSGMEQLDEIRSNLGPARLRGKGAARAS